MLDKLKAHPAIAIMVVSAVILTTVVTIAVVGNTPTETNTEDASQDEDTSVGQRETLDQAPDNENSVQKPPKEEEPVSVSETPVVFEPPRANLLPLNWHELSSAEKIALNPFDCPADENNIVNLSAEDGRCLEATTAENQSEDPPLMVEDPEINASDSFNFSTAYLDLEIRLEGLECISISELAKGRENHDLESVLNNFKKYKNDFNSLSSSEKWELLRMADAFEYLGNFQNYLSESQSLSVNLDNITSYLTQYKECLLGLTIRNVGEDSIFSDGCGLDMDDYVSLVDDYNQTYQTKYLGPGFACTEAEVPFPNGATDRARVYFVLPADRQVATYIFSNGDASIGIAGFDTETEN